MVDQLQQGRVLDGDLRTLGLQAILKMLSLGSKTGMLVLNADTETVSLHFTRGQICTFHVEGFPQPDIVEIFLLLQRIDKEIAEELSLIMPHQPLKVLENMVERELLSAEEYQAYWQFSVVQTISRILELDKGRFEFHRNLLSLDSSMQPLSVDQILLEADTFFDELAAYSDFDIDSSSVGYQLVDSIDKRTLRNIGDLEKQVFKLCNGSIPVHAMAFALLVSEGHIIHALRELAAYNLVEIVNSEFQEQLEQDFISLSDDLQYAASLLSHEVAESPRIELLKLLESCANGLLCHYARYFPVNSQEDLQDEKMQEAVAEKFSTLLSSLQSDFPVLETVGLNGISVDCDPIIRFVSLSKPEHYENPLNEAVLGMSQLVGELGFEIVRSELKRSKLLTHLEGIWQSRYADFAGKVQKILFQSSPLRSQDNDITQKRPSISYLARLRETNKKDI